MKRMIYIGTLAIIFSAGAAIAVPSSGGSDGAPACGGCNRTTGCQFVYFATTQCRGAAGQCRQLREPCVLDLYASRV